MKEIIRNCSLMKRKKLSAMTILKTILKMIWKNGNVKSITITLMSI